MNPHDLKMWAFVILGGALAYSGFCRAVVMSRTTRPQIRYAMSALTAAGVAVMLSALFRPNLLCNSLLGLLASMVYVQLVTSRFWWHGVPTPFVQGADRRRSQAPIAYGVDRRKH